MPLSQISLPRMSLATLSMPRSLAGTLILSLALLSPAAGTGQAPQDMGPAPASTTVHRLQLVLARSPRQEQALQTRIAQQQDRSSPLYRHWITPQEFGAAYGPADQDIATLTAWLQTQGFDSVHVNAGRTLVEFSASAASLRAAFHITLHRIESDGQTSYAADTDPLIPPAIAPLVRGFASLGNLPRTTSRYAAPTLRRDRKTGATSAPHPDNTIVSNGGTYYGLTPYDFAALYNVLPLWNAPNPTDGTAETIAIVGESDIRPADFVAFRSIFSLPLGNTNTASGTQYLNIIYNGNNPGIQPTEFHADSDTQWASAAAKGATIDYVASQTTEASLGIDLSAAYIVDNNLGAILVDSYFTCEAQLGTGGNAFYNALWQQAAAQGITVVTAAGDSGAAGCDVFHAAPALQGKAVSGIASTPYDLAVGGTEFYAPTGLAAYFNPSNDSHQASIKGYIPEIPWNDSCANPVIFGNPPYAGLSAEQVCNQATTGANGIAVTAGTGGGASATYPKPAWQSGPGVPADKARDLPDVALFASQGRENSYYLVCQSDRDPQSQPCNVDFPYSDFAGYGGTEVAAPAFAGILALAAEKAGGRIGLPNQTLYTLAARQASTACDSTGTTAAGCIFHDITQGTNAVPCAKGSPDCVVTTGGDAVGILSAPSAGKGYDLASGLGSVDAANLVDSFSSVTFAPVTAILNVSPSAVLHGSPVLATVTVAGTATPPTGEVTLNAQAANGSVGGGPLVGGTFSETFRNFPGGTYGVQAHYAGDTTNAAADSNFVSLTVTPEASATTIQALSYDPILHTATSQTGAPYGDIFYIRFNVQGQSGQGIATGNLAVGDTAQPYFGSGNVTRLNSSGYAEVQDNALAPGTHVFSATYQGDPSFNASQASPLTLVITQAPTTATLALSAANVSAAGTITFSATIRTQGYGYLPPSGTVTFSSGSLILGTSKVLGGVNPVDQQDLSTATLTLSAGNLPTGPNAIVATYSGDANYLGSASPASPLTVTATTLAPTTTFVFPTPYSVAPGGNILYTAIISPETPFPTGTVQFIVDGENVGAAQAIASGNYASALQTTVAGLSIGLHSLTATYSGDATHYRSSTSPASSFLITSPGQPSAVTFSANPTSLVRGTFISVQANVVPASPVATGTVQLVLDGGFYGSPVPLAKAGATLPLATTTLQVGTHVLGVFYSGDGTYATAYAQPVNLTITAPGATISSVAISGLQPLVPVGQDAVFSGVVSPGSPVPTGILQIILDGGNPGAPILLTGNSTALSIPAASLAAGPHTVKVFYSGDNLYNFSTSTSASFVVGTPVYVGDFNLSPPTLTLNLSRLNSINATLYTVTPTNGFNAPVTFSCAGLPANTSCTFTPATLTTTGTTPATTSLHFNLNTGLKGAAEPHRLFSARSVMEFAGLLCLGLPYALRRRATRLTRLASLLGLMAAATALNGCGGGALNVPGLTPIGTYDITITAYAPNVTHTARMTLVIGE